MEGISKQKAPKTVKLRTDKGRPGHVMCWREGWTISLRLRRCQGKGAAEDVDVKTAWTDQ